MATNHATTLTSFPPPALTERVRSLDDPEKYHLERLLNRRDTFGVPISSNDPLDEALTEITWILNHWPEGFNVKKEELLAVAAGAEVEDLPYLFGDIPEWFDEFLTSLNAWRSVSRSILRMELLKNYTHISSSDSETINGGTDELNGLLAEVMEAYAPADLETSRLSDYEFPATRELLKRYSRYTCAVCDLVKKLWPSANLERLLQQT